jgi:hypothetical protein
LTKLYKCNIIHAGGIEMAYKLPTYLAEETTVIIYTGLDRTPVEVRVQLYPDGEAYIFCDHAINALMQEDEAADAVAKAKESMAKKEGTC